ncbi:heavy-metal-associated domain-containing protein [Prosthecomicrobium sp. N25]|uniref:heavy-metal-associated domain-containing protein n=1 Tax=Prosthecomicrobium sp. N25 TaxID=3129254 RepID=UPI0030775919
MITLKVEGMTCMGCVKSVKNAIGAADPAAAVSVDLETGKVEVDTKLGRDAVVSAVEAAGYDVAAAA